MITGATPTFFNPTTTSDQKNKQISKLQWEISNSSSHWRANKMPLIDLENKEKEIVYECLKAVVYGPFIPDYGFHSLFGIEREDVKLILNMWPNIEDSNISTKLAINNSMLHLWGYPHGCDAEWIDWISVTPTEVFRILEKWKQGVIWPNS